MVEKIKEIQPPRGLTRLMFRLPIWFYRLDLGGLLGTRFLLLTHTGRKTGLPRQSVLEVVRYNKASDLFVVAAGFGTRSDWYQNVTANPQVTIDSGGRRIQAIARQLTAEEAGKELLDYHQRYPGMINKLARFMGYRLEGSEADVRALGEMLPMISFQPNSIRIPS
jgi:deazaflavin-dependent oxidoreductase (nitroreductase family)